jgi:hypothetical protein
MGLLDVGSETTGRAVEVASAEGFPCTDVRETADLREVKLRGCHLFKTIKSARKSVRNVLMDEQSAVDWRVFRVRSDGRFSLSRQKVFRLSPRRALRESLVQKLQLGSDLSSRSVDTRRKTYAVATLAAAKAIVADLKDTMVCQILLWSIKGSKESQTEQVDLPKQIVWRV